MSELPAIRPQADIQRTDTEVRAIHGELATAAENQARELSLVESEALARLREVLPEAAPRDLANVVRNLALAKGINVDKALTIRGKPVAIHRVEIDELRTAERVLAESGLLVDTDTQVVDAEVEEES